MKHFPGLVTIGYLLIFCCIGLIGYAYYYEWIKLDTLEQQNRETNKMQEDIIYSAILVRWQRNNLVNSIKTEAQHLFVIFSGSKQIPTSIIFL